jgi:hypothetical protein
MMRTKIVWGEALGACVLAALGVGTASAQQTSVGADQAQRPLIVERIRNGFVIAPDVKVTEVDDRFATLAGGYAGWVNDETLMIGGGGYWLANREDGFELAYGGFVAEWLTRRDRRIRFGVRGLAGVGTATLSDEIDVTRLPSFARFGSRSRSTAGPPSFTSTRRIEYRDEFFVFEPQASVLLRVTDRIGLSCGVGYRVIGQAGRLRDRLQGVSGSLALTLGLQ